MCIILHVLSFILKHFVVNHHILEVVYGISDCLLNFRIKITMKTVVFSQKCTIVALNLEQKHILILSFFLFHYLYQIHSRIYNKYFYIGNSALSVCA